MGAWSGAWVVLATVAFGAAVWLWVRPGRVPSRREGASAVRGAGATENGRAGKPEPSDEGRSLHPPPEVASTFRWSGDERQRRGVADRTSSPGGWAHQRAARARQPPNWLMRRRSRPRDVVGLLSALSAELAAGQVPVIALEQACLGTDPDPCPRARAAARVGADVADALRIDARAVDSSGLRALAACWQVSGQSGSGLAASVRRLADSERASQTARGELVAELATVRASAKLLAGLPLIGLLMGMLLGANPVRWLTSSPIGIATLLGGLLLQGAGLLWLQRIVASVRATIP